jgi:hypothetical protein
MVIGSYSSAPTNACLPRMNQNSSVTSTAWPSIVTLAPHHRARAAGMEWIDPAGPLSQWHALQELEMLERQYAAGDRFALLHAIRVCANHDLVIPLRAALAYIRCFDAVLTCRTDAWDDAFG